MPNVFILRHLTFGFFDWISIFYIDLYDKQNKFERMIKIPLSVAKKDHLNKIKNTYQLWSNMINGEIISFKLVL